MDGTTNGRLYSPEILKLAVQLADFPLDRDFDTHSEARSRSCGSTLKIGLDCDNSERISQIGLRVTACAVGQAAAAIFAGASFGTDIADLETAQCQLERWLHENGEQPDWSGMQMLEPARAYSARHDAILLPWKAAIAALSNAQPSG